MVIVIVGILSAVISPLIANKFSAVAQSTDRAKWVQQAEFALFHIRQDLASSVPNSVFTTSAGLTVEFLSIPVANDLYAARYRNKNLNGYNNLKLNNDDGFDIFGSHTDAPGYVSVATESASNMRTDWTNLLAGSNNGSVATVSTIATGTGVTGSPITTINLTSAHTFPEHSPYYRAYFFNGPIGYECDLANGVLYRVSSYTSLSTAQNFTTRSALAERNRVATDVVDCKFTLASGASHIAPTLRVTLAIGRGTEKITLIDTIILSNAL